ncbi:MAG TPA: HDOD domain-containing protein [Candidatus Marinimicrobia bacterium]|nr:HDOD domain-containing protein [Candidatus Neomarinimicrobiota bacterium]
MGLPTIPIIATEVLKITRENRISVNQLVVVIEKDPSMGMKLLKVANSAFYGIREKVDSLRRAVVILGFKELSSLVTGISIIKAFAQNDEAGIEWKKFWEHCAATGHISEIICGRLGIFLPAAPYTSGLLHDIGKLVLYRIDARSFLDSMRLAEQENYPPHIAEMEIFGINHMDAGKWMAQKWRLPAPIIHAIGYHHNLEETLGSEYSGSTALIQFADFITNLMGVNFGTQFIPEEVAGWYELQTQYASVDEVDLEELILELKDQFKYISDMVKIVE